MIREVLRILSLTHNFIIIKPPLDLFLQDLKILMSVIVMFWVSTQLFLPILSQNLSKIQNFINKYYVSTLLSASNENFGSPICKLQREISYLWQALQNRAVNGPIAGGLSISVEKKSLLLSSCTHSAGSTLI